MMVPLSGRDRFTGKDDYDAKETYTLTEGEDIDEWWPLVTVVRVHETDIPADACVTRTPKHTKASSTSAAAQTGSGVRPPGPISTVSVGGNGNGNAQATAALTGAAGFRKVEAEEIGRAHV